MVGTAAAMVADLQVDDSIEIQLFIAVIMVLDVLLICVNLFVIWCARASASKVFDTTEKWNRFLNAYTKAVLSYLPVTDDMSSEFTADAEEA